MATKKAGKTRPGGMKKAAKPSFPAMVMRDYLASARTIYLSAVHVLAEELRPRFEAGELHAARDSEFAECSARRRRNGMEPRETHSAQEKVEAACAERFDLAVLEDNNEPGVTRYDGNEVAAYTVLACSPSAIATHDTWNHPCHHAAHAAGWDVILSARRAGWYRPTRDECKDP